jgi:hypothetical protein
LRRGEFFMELEYRIQRHRENISDPKRFDTLDKKQVFDDEHPEWIIYQYTIEGTPIDVRADLEGIYHVHVPLGEAHMRVIMTHGSAYAWDSKNKSIVDIFRR